MLDHACTNGIQHNISAHCKEMTVLLYENGLVPSLEKMPRPVVSLIERLGIDPIQLPHTEREIPFGCFDEEMIVVVHETIGMTAPAVVLVDLCEDLKKRITIDIVLENILLLVPSGCNMIYSSRIFDA
jgi:hypothetical protein